jgi:hypothetical protein
MLSLDFKIAHSWMNNSGLIITVKFFIVLLIYIILAQFQHVLIVFTRCDIQCDMFFNILVNDLHNQLFLLFLILYNIKLNYFTKKPQLPYL